jgi:hypothetical protein
VSIIINIKMYYSLRSRGKETDPSITRYKGMKPGGGEKNVSSVRWRGGEAVPAAAVADEVMT